jgi:hypothetical protein
VKPALCFCAIIVACSSLGPRAAAQHGEADPAIARALEYLKGQAGAHRTGETALIALTLAKADVPATDPALRGCLEKIMLCFTSQGYIPERRGGTDIYEAGIVAMVLSTVEPVVYKAHIEAVVAYLLAKQKANGSWDYDQRTAGDTSISQYAVLGLWEAENAGIEVPGRVWDNVASWYMSTQQRDGGWVYHPDEGAGMGPQTVSLTAAGVGSLMICNRQLARYRKGMDSVHPMLTPLLIEGEASGYKPYNSSASVNNSIRRGLDWLSRGFVPAQANLMGRSTYYGMYGMERVGALGDRQMMRGLGSWYERGMEFTLQDQKPDGTWNRGDFNATMNTCWATLYLLQATAKTIRKIEILRLGAGRLLGGRGLPDDLNNLTIAQGRVVVRPMNGAVEGMIAVLEDPSATNADAALAGLIERYDQRGPDVLRPFKDRFRKLLYDRDPGVRRVACWALGRTGDLDVVGPLVRMLLDPEEGVVAEARVSLELLSRKAEGYGPPRGATIEQKVEAARRWRAWYESVRPIGLDPLDEIVAPKAAAGGGS